MVLLSSQAVTQVSISIFAVYVPPDNYLGQNRMDPLARYWKRGIFPGGSIEVTLTRFLAVSSSFEYSVYEISERFLPGEDSHASRFFIEAKLPSLQSTFPFYLSSGVGYISEVRGGVTDIFYDPKGVNPPYPRRIDFPTNNYFVHTVGIGYRIIVVAGWGFELRMDSFSNYSDRFQMAAKSGIVFVL